ncbi:MAG: DNA topoisomerase 4 subunit A [Lachnospiraceae bacterium]|nr:DNA topoisomerase 4 subunit A [Lachnospiraceae bacterium]
MAEQIIKTEYSEVMQKSYIDYSMSVITARALPDARDGLKPVQRRVLYAMDQLGLNYDKPHRKSARIVGDAMGKYHPHGDSSIYETLVVLSQDFKKGMALVDGHGNFGSIEGDGAAAMRYTEAKLKKYTQDVYLKDLDKDVVDFIPNFDETEKEPEVLPVKVPNLLVNGAEGIAVGMVTNIPTHNLGEVVDAVVAYMEKNSITTEELMEIIPGPDFPTGGIVANKSELLDIYSSGIGKIKLRGKVEFEPGQKKSDKDKLVITEIPYTMIGANIGKFMSDVYDLVETKKTTDIVDISNQSSKEGIRIVLELKKGADVEALENLLYKKTKLEDTFSVNMLAIADGRPEVMGLKDIIKHSVDFQYEIAERKYTTLLNKALAQKEIKEGLIKATDIIDLIIEVIRGSKNRDMAKKCLMNGETDGIKFKNKESAILAGNLNFTESQAKAILELQLYKLIGLEVLQLKKEYDELMAKISTYEDILQSRKSMTKAIKKELLAIKKEYAVDRRTVITDAKEAVVVEKPEVEMEYVFVMDRFGYTKLLETSVYDRNIESINNDNKYYFRCLNTDRISFFTSAGNMHQIKVKDVPIKKLKDKGVPIDNISNYDSSAESLVAIFANQMISDRKLLFATKQGFVKIVDSSEFDVTRKTIAATKLNAGDEVVSVHVTAISTSVPIFDEPEDIPVILSGGSEDDFMSLDDEQLEFDFMSLGNEPLEDSSDIQVSREHLVLQTEEGIFLKFAIKDIPEKKKGAVGVRGIKLGKEDYVAKTYLIDAGDNVVITFKEKEVELKKLKLGKRDTKGVKIRL